MAVSPNLRRFDLRKCLSLLLLVGMGGLFGCHRRMHSASAPAQPLLPERSYIDLQSGWRIRVVTPLLKPGAKVSDEIAQQTSGNTVTVVAGSNFLGYATDYYQVTSREHGGVQINFSSAQVTKDEHTFPRSFPNPKLFVLPRRTIFVRLLYLQRVSLADHNMAVLGSNRKDRLESLTRKVEADPNACTTAVPTVCYWIPVGIAVRPEIGEIHNGGEQWIPAR